MVQRPNASYCSTRMILRLSIALLRFPRSLKKIFRLFGKPFERRNRMKTVRLCYELVSLITGKAKNSEEDKLTIMAVGDDDQSIYGFAGANVEFIRRYETDYANPIQGNKANKTYMERHYLVENYRSTQSIIVATNRLIFHNKDRMKVEYPIIHNKERNDEPQGGGLEKLDPVSKGMVQILNAQDRVNQAEACVAEIQRLKGIVNETRWSDFCVFARTNRELNIVRLALEDAGVPIVVLGAEAMPKLSRVWIIYNWLNYLKENQNESWSGDELLEKLELFLSASPTKNLHGQMLRTIASVFYGETGGTKQQVEDIRFFFIEICAEKQVSSNMNAVRLSTAHKAKGLEFDYVFILDGEWNTNVFVRNLEEERRVFYVAMTRAKCSLSIFQLKGLGNQFVGELVGSETLERTIETSGSLADKIDIECSILSLGDLWIDFAATRRSGDKSLHAIDCLRSGDRLNMHSFNASDGRKRLDLRNSHGVTVAYFSRNGVGSWTEKLPRIVKIQVVGVHIRKASDGDQSFVGRAPLREEWGIPICEVYFKSDGCC